MKKKTVRTKLIFSIYCARAQDAPQEMEGNLATAELMAWLFLSGCSLVSLHFLWGILHTSTVEVDVVNFPAATSAILFTTTLCSEVSR